MMVPSLEGCPQGGVGTIRPWKTGGPIMPTASRASPVQSGARPPHSIEGRFGISSAAVWRRFGQAEARLRLVRLIEHRTEYTLRRGTGNIPILAGRFNLYPRSAMLIAAQRRLRGVRRIEQCGTRGNVAGASVSPVLRGADLPGASGRLCVSSE